MIIARFCGKRFDFPSNLRYNISAALDEPLCRLRFAKASDSEAKLLLKGDMTVGNNAHQMACKHSLPSAVHKRRSRGYRITL